MVLGVAGQVQQNVDFIRMHLLGQCGLDEAIEQAIIATRHLYYDQPEAMRKLWVSRVPMGRPGTPEEVAAMIAWLASEECSFTTGAAFDLSGGRATY